MDKGTTDTNVGDSVKREFSTWFTYVFIIVLIIYFVIKQNNDCSLYTQINPLLLTPWTRLTGNGGKMMFLLVLLFCFLYGCQIWQSSNYLNTLCKNNEANNAAIAAKSSWPWFALFLATVIALALFPQLKKVFSYTIGYIFVANSLNSLFAKILKQKVEDCEKACKDATKNELEQKRSLLTKLVQEQTIVANIISPEMFETQWNQLTPFIQEGELETGKQQLFNLILRKDNIGEFVWYLLAGLLTCGYSTYIVSSRGCEKSAEQIKSEFYA
jgi:hypothetical protein